jgi:hypothetical protein
MTEYKPSAPQQQPKFAGIKTYLRLPHLKTTRGLDFAVVGIPWDGATSYRAGQRLGPDAIRKVSVTLRPYNPISVGPIITVPRSVGRWEKIWYCRQTRFRSVCGGRCIQKMPTMNQPLWDSGLLRCQRY